MTNSPTILLRDSALSEACEVVVDGDAYRHFFRARRLASGAAVRVTDGRGEARLGVVGAVERDRATIELGAFAPSAESRLRLSLAVATLRPERASTLVEKVTEVGVEEILWFNSERAPRSVRTSALARMVRVAESAVAQSGRSRTPRISVLESWGDLVQLVSGRPSVVFDLSAPVEPPVQALGQVVDGLDLAQGEEKSGTTAPLLLIGPEGGFTTFEREQLSEAGARAVWLGPRTLRAETAAIVGCSMFIGWGTD